MACLNCSETPYRNADVVEPPKPRRKLVLPRILRGSLGKFGSFVLHVLVGCIVILGGSAAVCIGFWLLFPGVFRLGDWALNDLCHLQVRDDVQNGPPGCLPWFAGIVLLLSPFFVRMLGRGAINRLFRR